MNKTVTKFLEEYDDLTQADPNVREGTERILYNLLKANQKHIETTLLECSDYFHKSFRQTDMCDTGEMDMAIWICLGKKSDIFWELLDKYVKDGSFTA